MEFGEWRYCNLRYTLKIHFFTKICVSVKSRSKKLLHSQLSTLHTSLIEWRVKILQSPLYSQNPLFFIKIHVSVKKPQSYKTLHSQLFTLHTYNNGTRHTALPHRLLNKFIFSDYSFSLRQAIPGRILPSRNSSDAPPPVEICVILSA